MNFDELGQVTQHIFTARKKTYFKQTLLDLHAPLMANTLRVSTIIDQHYLKPLIMALCETLQGEVIEETRLVRYSYEFEVFQTWWDHLKYVLQRKYPRALKRLKVNYQKVVKYKEEIIPVRVVRTCPHFESVFEESPEVHISYMFPLEWSKLQK